MDKWWWNILYIGEVCTLLIELELLHNVDWQEKGVYEKVGEATETALVVLSEKMNVTAVDCKKLSRKEFATASMNAMHRMWHKDFTLEFSRDRKSMSCYCTPTTTTKLGAEPKMFVKVRRCVVLHSQLKLFTSSGGSGSPCNTGQLIIL